MSEGVRGSRVFQAFSYYTASIPTLAIETSSNSPFVHLLGYGMRYSSSQNKGTLIITALNRGLLEEYGQDFLDTFPHKHLDLTVFSEDAVNIPHARLTYTDFATKHKDKPTHNYKMNAVKFSWKPQAIHTALDLDYISNYDSIVWLDADIVFLKDITQEWIDEHLRTEHIMSYMGRPNYYSECGVLFFNLKHDNTRTYIQDVWDYYLTERVFELSEWHDSYVFDYVRSKRQLDNCWKFKDLGVDYKVRGGHIAVHLYGEWFDHRKGKRKRGAKSPENTVNNRRK